MNRILASIFFAVCCLTALGKEIIPPAPENHFNDYANVVAAGTASQLNGELADFERATGNQVVVAVFPKMQTDSSIEEYTVRVARAWKVGTKEKNNGAVLFVFVQDHKLYIQTGYGLEGALPDALCKRIIEDEIVPRFKASDYNGGLTAGVHAIMAATKGEYRGTGKTVVEQQGVQLRARDIPNILFVCVFVGFIIYSFIKAARQNYTITGRRRSGIYWNTGSSGGWFSGGGGGSFSGGGGGGSFSGGGGSFGGGGAGGSW